jgi:hypothetical protein
MVLTVLMILLALLVGGFLGRSGLPLWISLPIAAFIGWHIPEILQTLYPVLK